MRIIGLQNRYLQFGLALLSGLLLGLAWHKPFTPLIFIGFVPFLVAEYQNYQQKHQQKARKSWLLAMGALLVWNFTACGWLHYVGWSAFLFAVIANSFLQSLPFLAFHFFRRKIQQSWAYASLPIFWITFEKLHTTDWGFSWTWLNLGNAFATLPAWVQWYEYTGVFGGSLWVWLVNLFMFFAIIGTIQSKIQHQNQPANDRPHKGLKSLLGVGISLVSLSASFLLPLLLSLLLGFTYEEKGKAIEVVVVQPNFDTYTEKFFYNARTGELNLTTAVSFEKQFNIFLELTKQQATNETALVLFPETSIHDDRQTEWNEAIEEPSADSHPYVKRLAEFRAAYPKLSVLSGTDSYVFYYNSPQPPTATAHLHSPNTYYDVFNAALFLDTQNKPSFYHKSRLVVGVESNPLRSVLGFLQKTVMANFSGLIGDLGVQAERQVFTTADQAKAAPIICYESIYGEFVTEYVKKGATILCILTNDAWWDDSSAPRQHFSFASLRAIETRRAIARAANTGISGFINAKGEVLQRIEYGEKAALRGKLILNDYQTFYVRFGDWIAKGCIGLAVLLLVWAVVVKKKV